MWNNQEYSRSRSHSFSNHTRQPAYPYDPPPLRAPSPAFPTPQFGQGMMQPSPTPRAMSSVPGGFVMPTANLGAPLPAPALSSRGRSNERGGDLMREHKHSSHSKPERHRHHTHEHGHVHGQNPDHRHKHREHKHKHSHERPHGNNTHEPHIHVHVNGQMYSVPRPTHHHQPSAVSVTAMPSGNQPHNAVHVHHTAAAPHRTHESHRHSMQMPVPTMPPQEPQYYGPQPEKQKHLFQYSLCTGRKKALCIGVNYYGQENELKGCINDANRMHDFLINHYGFHKGDIVLLTDDRKTPRKRPTRQNILDAMNWLVKDAHCHDSLVFHYSGHGGQTPDLDGDESDGEDEVIYPVDFKKYGHIVDDEMHTIMVKPLPRGCRLVAVFDSCHSGSALDLPYTYGKSGRLEKEPNLTLATGARGVLDIAQGLRKNNMNTVTRAFDGLMRKAGGGNAAAYTGRAKTSPADVIQWAGCKDSQTSADTYEAGTATGAMSYAFMKTLKENPNQSYQELLTNIRDILKNRFSQKPQLSSSHPIDTRVKFLM